MVFLADRFGVGDGDLEYEVKFVVDDVVFDVTVLDHANETNDLSLDAEFFSDLADESGFHALARLDVTSGQE